MDKIRLGLAVIVLGIFLQGCTPFYTSPPSYPPSPFHPLTLMGWNPPSITYRDYYQSAIPNESFYTSAEDSLGWGRPATGMYGL